MSPNIITKFLLPVICLLVLYASADAQILNGLVKDDNNDPVVGAYVVDSKLKNHAHTNELGQFNIAGIGPGDTLQIHSIGYKTSFYIVSEETSNIEVTLVSESYLIDGIVIRQNITAINQLSKIDLIKNPVSSSQQILRVVPGLFVGQHAGGGKAEQIFLRGFDIDHGTDLAISMDGLPVNMVSHAHGQGYADLHFIIPEVIENIDYNKGPYYTQQGNFATAGYVDFKMKNKLNNNLVGLEIGQFNTNRFLGMMNLINTDKSDLYVATEYIQSDGPFDSPQNFDRLNVMSRYSTTFADKSQLSLTLSHFDSQWDASGQIPFREVNNGNITRFGAIDDTEGGNTSRTNAMLYYNKRVNESTFVKNNLYYSKYDFTLFSNFTFFLNDSINGDQIKQQEDRSLFGFNSELNHAFQIADRNSLLQVGAGFRGDRIEDVELSNTANRKTTLLERQLGDVNEVNAFAYANLEWEFGDLLVNPGLRFDHFNFNYYDKLAPSYDPKTESAAVVSPKLNLLYNLNQNAQFYLKSGIGFHSNDTRVVIEEDEGFVPPAYGADLGVIWKPTKKLLINTAAWYLLSDQEFVYVGDEGIVEPSGQSERLGLDLSLRYEIMDWLYLDTDWTWVQAESVDDPEGENYIPLAPLLTGSGGVSVNLGNFDGSLRFRFLDDRPANEDNSIVAEGYFISDLNLNYKLGQITLGLSVENILDSEWEETQFATESRLSNEPSPIEEIHFTPGTPRFVKGRITYNF